jgi:hypothetical protein
MAFVLRTLVLSSMALGPLILWIIAGVSIYSGQPVSHSVTVIAAAAGSTALVAYLWRGVWRGDPGR